MQNKINQEGEKLVIQSCYWGEIGYRCNKFENSWSVMLK